MNYFLCDVIGTFTGNENNRKEELVNFVENLKNIIEKDNLDNLYFSFISTDNIESVIKCMYELETYLDDDRIKIIKSFGEKESYDFHKIEPSKAGKLLQIASLLKDRKVKNIYFADDCEIYHMLVGEYLYEYLKELNSDKENYVPFENLTHFSLGMESNTYEFSMKTTSINSLNILMNRYITRKVKKLDSIV